MADAAERWTVSAFTVVTWRAGRLEITCANSGAALATNDPDMVRILNAFARPKTIAEGLGELAAAASPELAAQIQDLIRAGALVSASERELAAAQHWEWSALAYHRRSRRSSFRKAPAPVVPRVPAVPGPTWIALSQSGAATGRDFADVIEARRSVRAWPAVPLAFDGFSRLLWLSARNRKASDDALSDEPLSRPYPSGGASYSLELYVVMAEHAVATIPEGLYRYAPELHALEPVPTPSTARLALVETAGRSAGAAPPPILLLVTSRFARQSEAYADLAYGLVLKEVGCLFQTLYLAAEYLGLGACALGGGVAPGQFARLLNTSELVEPLVGEFMLGPR